MAYDIGPRIGIEGEAQFRQAINSLNTSFRTLGTEMAAVTSQFDRNDRSSQALTAQNGVLNRQIDTQRERLVQLNAGLAQATERYGENHRVTQGWQQAVNSANASLSTMERSLEANSRSITLQNSNWTRLGQTLDSVGTRMKTVGEGMSNFGQKMAMGITAPLVGAGVATAKLASDLSENMNKVDVAFGKNSTEVKTWSDTTLQSFGISKGSALEMASLFGDMASGMDINTEQASIMSTKMVGLAGDLASFKNIGLDQASDALKGIFTGEGESLKSLGVIMLDSTLSAFALETGQKKLYKDMDQGEKVMLRYNYVLDKTKNSSGDFARTSDGTANQTRIFGETIKELGANMGQYILPVVTPLITRLSELAQSFGKLDESTKKTILVVAGIVAALGPVLVVTGSVITAVGSIAGVFGAASTAIAAAGGIMAVLTGPIGITVAVIAGLIAVGVLLYQNWDTIKAKAQELWASTTTTFSNITSSISGAWESVKSVTSGAWESLKSSVSNGLGAILDFIQPALTFYQTIFKNAWDLIKNTVLGAVLIIIDIVTGDFTKLGTDIDGIWNNIKTALSNIWNAIKDVATTAWTALKTSVIEICTSIINGAKDLWNGLLAWFRELPGKLQTVGSEMFTSMKTGVKSTITTVKDAIVTGITTAIDWIKALPGQALTWGSDFIDGFKTGITNAMDGLLHQVQKVAESIRSFLHFSTPDQGPLADYETWMPDFMAGLANGIEANKYLVANAINGLSTDMTVGINTRSIPAITTASTSGGSRSSGGVTIINQGTIVGSNGMNEFADIVSRKIANGYGLGTGGAF